MPPPESNALKDERLIPQNQQTQGRLVRAQINEENLIQKEKAPSLR